jgi:hypothetical protein
MLVIDIIGIVFMGGLAIALQRVSEQEVEPLKTTNCFGKY